MKHIITYLLGKCRKKIPVWAFFLFLSGMVLSTACEDIIMRPDPADSPSAVFEHLWTDARDRYSFFKVKNIDWEEIGNQYRSQISDGMSDQQLFKLLVDMLYELKDGHVTLSSAFERSPSWEWYKGYPDNYNQTLVDRYYLKRDHLVTGPLRHQVIDSILYVSYRTFSDNLTELHIDQLMSRAQGLRGVIIDVRHNSGGSLRNARLLASCFTDRQLTYARQRYKTGPGTHDFTSWEDITLSPRSGQRFAGPVVLLTNRRSYSTSTFFAQMMRTIPHATLIGDYTGGGGGIPVTGELPNGWTYRLSASQAITPDGDHMELGVPVDIKTDLISSEVQKGVDTIIETALDYIQSL